MSEEAEVRAEPKRGPGRPKANPVLEREPTREPRKWDMHAAPNWEGVDPTEEDSPDRLHIAASMIPEGLSFQWVTDSVYGQPTPQHRANFEKRGWTPVHQSDFDGRFDGMFMPKGQPGEVKCDGLVLMARPSEMSERAKLLDRRKASEQVLIKEQALKGGDMPIGLDAQHPTALRSNMIKKSYERIEVPDK